MSQKKKNNDNFDINANSPNHEIRSFFIDTTIEAIRYMSHKAYNGRIRDTEFEKIKVQQLKVIINACNVGNRVLKDRQLDDYEREMIELKQGLMYDKTSGDFIEISPDKISEIEDLDFKLERLRDEGVSDNGN